MARIKPHTGPETKQEFRKRNKKVKNREGKCPKFLSWQHKLCCCITLTLAGNYTDQRRVDAHHIRLGLYALGMKNDDSMTVPLRHDFHTGYPQSLHTVGEENFWREHGINPVHLAEDLYQAFLEVADPTVGRSIIRHYHFLSDIKKSLYVLTMGRFPSNSRAKVEPDAFRHKGYCHEY